MKNIKPLLIAFIAIVISVASLQIMLLFVFLHQLQSLRQYEHTQIDPLVKSLVQVKYDVVQIQQYLTDAAVTQESDGIADAKKNTRQCRKKYRGNQSIGTPDASFSGFVASQCASIIDEWAANGRHLRSKP
ncbi:hypothetical protein [Deefgea sp. CFH1-16]|uniref:hypothetical protein n=1 Tax=Deefgea sp. CFH1-16 TaxID=2675457 RepID=UPI0015F531EB|nr:hypothetical protein [Deefgea sp. CFH1-16]MBM5574046.1 hypothetical protein [Deefgea sp. CFH1-16]